MIYAIYEEFGIVKKFISFPLEVEGKNSYRAQVSLKNFCGREFDKIAKLYKLTEKYRKDVQWIESKLKNSCTIIIEDEKSFKEYMELKPTVSVVTVNSIWEMYKEIGYNHKTQKYLGA